MKERTFRRLAADLVRGKDISPTTVAKHRGFFAGMQFLLNSPEISYTALQREVEKLDTAEGDED